MSSSTHSSEHLIGVDLGTSVVKTTLFDINGLAIVDATRDARLSQPSPGIAEQSGDEFYAAALDAIAEVVERSGIVPSAVAAIAFDGQMAGAIGIDRDWNAITPWYPSALDARYQPYVNTMVERGGERVVALNGSLPFMGPRMLWWQETAPELYARIDKVLIIANFVAGRMAGLQAADAFIDPSYLTWIGVSDTANRAWSAELAETCGISLEKLPRIVPSTSIIGHLSAEAARHCGLSEGVPLVAGAGDQVAGALGAGLVDEGQLVEVAGTFPVLATSLNRYFSDTQHGMLQPLAGPLAPDHWYPMMYISGGGLTHRWFVDKFADEVKAEAMARGVSPYHLLDEQAAAVPPGAEGLLFIPHLVGRACPNDPDIRGAWLGFTWTHERRHFYRSLLESIVYDYAQALNVVREYLPDTEFSEVRIIGGGAKSSFWNQLKADVLGLPYVLLPRQDVAALGTAIMGGHAVGIFPDMAEAARRFAPPGQRIEPRPHIHERYRPYVAAYQAAFDDLRPTFARLTPLSQQMSDE
ncbi:MAG: xylulose kinase [Caldilineales bacterium]|nr:xylulose kinase [Caldilineales bacterium]